MRTACVVVVAGAVLFFGAAWCAGMSEGGSRPADGPPARAAQVAAPWAKGLFRILLLLAAAALVATAALILFERRFIFYPTREPAITWDAPEPGIEDCTFQAVDGVELHGWWHPGKGQEEPSGRPVLLWCHGNAGNITDRAENLMLLAHYGFAALLFDYRGYGKSQGEPSETGLYLDAEAAYDYLTEQRRVEPERLICFGQSLGAAVALHVALERPIAGLIMESPFASIPAMARHKAPFLPAWLLVRTRFDNLGRVPQLRVPLLVVHGERDELVPLTQGRAVYDAAPEPKHFYAIEGAGHNDTYAVGGVEYFLTLKRFADRCLADSERRRAE